MNGEQVLEFRKMYYHIKEQAEGLLMWYHKNVEEVYAFDTLDFKGIVDGDDYEYPLTLLFSGYIPSGCGCCPGEDPSFELDYKILYDEDYKKELVEAARKKKDEKKKKDDEMKRIQNEKKKKNDLELLTTLKEKYE